MADIGTFRAMISVLTSKIYDQSKEIEELELAGWKYRALRATLPANNANVIWLGAQRLGRQYPLLGILLNSVKLLLTTKSDGFKNPDVCSISGINKGVEWRIP